MARQRSSARKCCLSFPAVCSRRGCIRVPVPSPPATGRRAPQRSVPPIDAMPATTKVRLLCLPQHGIIHGEVAVIHPLSTLPGGEFEGSNMQIKGVEGLSTEQVNAE